MFYTVDRIEGDRVIIFDGGDKEVVAALRFFPKNVKEGDILSFDGEKYIFDADRTIKAKAEINARFEKLLKKTNRDN